MVKKKLGKTLMQKNASLFFFNLRFLFSK